MRVPFEKPNGQDFMELGWPTCARCGKGVDSVMESRDFGLRGWHFVVWCHGEREEAVIAYEMARDAKPGDIKFGEAFVEPRHIADS